MSKELLLDDLEDFVNGDWKDIFEEHKAEEYRKEVSEPVIPDFHTYEEFYNLLVYQIGKDIPSELEYLIHRIIAYQDRKSNKSFENVWQMFCNPSKYRVMEEDCKNCNNKISVITTRSSTITVFRNSELFRPIDSIRQEERVHCPSCGYCFMITTGKVVGVFSNREVT